MNDDTCEMVDYLDGPHPGCSEFAEPDVLECDRPGLHVVVSGDPWEVDEYRAVTCPMHLRRYFDEPERGSKAMTVVVLT